MEANGQSADANDDYTIGVRFSQNGTQISGEYLDATGNACREARINGTVQGNQVKWKVHYTGSCCGGAEMAFEGTVTLDETPVMSGNLTPIGNPPNRCYIWWAELTATKRSASKSLTNVALGKAVSITTNGADDPYSGAGEWSPDVTDGSLDYEPAGHHREDGVIGFVNNEHDQLMVINVTIDLQKEYHITKIRYNMGHVQRAETWNADSMTTPFGTTPTNPASLGGDWSGQIGKWFNSRPRTSICLTLTPAPTVRAVRIRCSTAQFNACQCFYPCDSLDGIRL